MKRLISGLLATLLIATSAPAAVLTAYATSDTVSGANTPPLKPVDPKNDYSENGNWVSPNDTLAYENQQKLGNIGLPEVNRNDLGAMQEAAISKSKAPSIDEISKLSADKVNLSSQKALYGMGTLVDYMTKKQITLGEMEAIMWSFIVSQFAEPYQENIQDVLGHPIFKQMAEKDLEIDNAPTDATAGAVAWQEVFKPNTKISDKVKFGKIAKIIYDKTEYMQLVDYTGTQQVTLGKYLSAPLGSVFYIRDKRATLEGADNKEVWNNRSTLFATYGSKIKTEELLIPVYVASNPNLIQNQVNFGSFLKGQAQLSSETNVPSYEVIAGKNGSMTQCKMYTDQFGNICVYHNNKMKIVLCNAQNTIFTSRPDEDDEFKQIISTVNGANVSYEDLDRIAKIPMQFAEMPGNTTPSTYLDPAAGSDANDISQDYAGKKPADEALRKSIETIYGADFDYTLKSNESLAAFSKPLMSCYSRSVTSGAWDGDKSIHFSGDTEMEDYPGYVQFEIAAQGARRNQLIFVKAPGMVLQESIQLDTVRKMIQGTGATKYSPEYKIPTQNLTADNFMSQLDYADWDGPTVEMGGETYNLKTDLVYKYRDANGDKMLPTQSILSNKKNSFIDVWESTSKHSSSISRTIPFSRAVSVAEWSNAPLFKQYAFLKEAVPSTGNSNLRDLKIAALSAYNYSLSAIMGTDAANCIPDMFYSTSPGKNTTKDTGGRSYTVGNLLVSSLDYGQYWEIVNEAMDPDYLNNLGADGDRYAIDFYSMPQISNTLALRPGLLLPFNKYVWTNTENNLQSLIDTMDAVADKTKEEEKTKAMKGWMESENAKTETDKELVKNFEHIFADNIYLQLRDTRVSDKWVIYGKEDVSLISYVWLNYYLPKSLWARSFISGTYETTPMLQEFVKNYATGVEGAGSQLTAEQLEALNKPGAMDKTETPNIDGSTNTKWRDSTIIIGPYIELMGSGAAERMQYDFYPDCSPFPALISQASVDTASGDFKTVMTKSDHLTFSAYDLLMGLFCNTNPEVNSLAGIERGPEQPLFNKSDILQGLWQMVKFPGQSLVSILATLSQYIHGALASSSFANFFQLNWIFGTGVWQTVLSYYFIIMLGLIAVSSIYLFFNLLLDKKQGLFVTVKRLMVALVLCVVPMLLMNTMIIVTDKITKNTLNVTLDKSSVAEAAAYTYGVANANAKFEYSYQLFRDQFDSVEDTICEYGYQLPVEYFTGLDTFRYANKNLQETIRDTSWVNNQSNTKWYDYRAFVPVHKDKYSQDLFYYFYDYMKWQYLEYLATAPDDSSIKIGTRAREYQFGFEDTLQAPGEGASVEETAQYLLEVSKRCRDPESKFIKPTEESSKSKAKFIENLEKVMLQTKGDYVIMMNDPNYIYGRSFTKEGNKQLDEYMLEDMFGLGFLLTDRSTEWEASDELYKYKGWKAFVKNSAMAPMPAKNFQGVNRQQNDPKMIDDVDVSTKKACPGINSRDQMVFGSELSLKSWTGFDTNVHKGMPMSKLEIKLDKLNKDIYKRVGDITAFFPADTPSETYLCLSAMAATFEFNKAFGGNWSATTIEPTGYLAQSVSYDSALRGIFARSPNDLLASRQLMYMIVDNSGGMGLATIFILLLGDLMAFIMAIARNLLVALIFIFAVVLCAFTYMIKQKKRSTLLLGIGTQCCGLVFTHLVMTLGLNLITKFSAGAGSAWKDALMALMLLLILSADAFVHFILILAIKKDFMNMGGNFFAEKFSGIFDKIKANMSGSGKFEKSSFSGIFKQKTEEEKLIAQKQQSQEKLNKRLKKLASKDAGIEAGNAAGMLSMIPGLAGIGKLAQMGMKRKFAKSKGAALDKQMEMGVDTDAFSGGANEGTRVRIGSDARFDTGGIIKDAKFAKKAEKLKQQEQAKIEKINKQLAKLGEQQGEDTGEDTAESASSTQSLDTSVNTSDDRVSGGSRPKKLHTNLDDVTVARASKKLGGVKPNLGRDAKQAEVGVSSSKGAEAKAKIYRAKAGISNGVAKSTNGGEASQKPEGSKQSSPVVTSQLVRSKRVVSKTNGATVSQKAEAAKQKTIDAERRSKQDRLVRAKASAREYLKNNVA